MEKLRYVEEKRFGNHKVNEISAAAAQDLLEACKACKEALIMAMHDLGPGGGLNNFIEQAEEAINKAEGRYDLSNM